MDIQDLHRRLADTGKYDPGNGSRPAQSINNNVFFILFALIGCGMVLSSIWFFFVHPRGGFHWKQTDWEDYKTTVLRRKGPDGKTLSNATKSTRLGGGSHAPKFKENERYTDASASSFGDPEMGQMMHGANGDGRGTHRNSRGADPELYAYRHEKPAKVGGMNAHLEGSHYDYTVTDRSEMSSEQAKPNSKAAKKTQKERERREKAELKQAAKDNKNKLKKAKAAPAKPQTAAQAYRAPPSAAYSFITGDDTASIYTEPAAPRGGTVPSQSNSYYSSYRPHPTHTGPTLRAVPEERASQRSSPSHSPKKQHRESRGYGDDVSSQATSSADTGTKSYPCHIPGLSKGEVGVDDSISQVGAHAQPRRAAQNGGGFRRSRE
jgi:hypothetical protein